VRRETASLRWVRVDIERQAVGVREVDKQARVSALSMQQRF
jgi:hypothetical protein